MSEYEKILRKRLKRDTFIGLGIIALIMILFVTVVIFL